MLLLLLLLLYTHIYFMNHLKPRGGLGLCYKFSASVVIKQQLCNFVNSCIVTQKHMIYDAQYKHQLNCENTSSKTKKIYNFKMVHTNWTNYYKRFTIPFFFFKFPSLISYFWSTKKGEDIH